MIRFLFNVSCRSSISSMFAIVKSILFFDLRYSSLWCLAMWQFFSLSSTVVDAPKAVQLAEVDTVLIFLNKPRLYDPVLFLTMFRALIGEMVKPVFSLQSSESQSSCKCLLRACIDCSNSSEKCILSVPSCFLCGDMWS